ncbi:uncharacterized protein [Halyomorpha halys]|uniref:uncharacterized protein n=1 Tax=Halyomorpha halys TaxID=286706 RepID=UPI0006D51CE6
MHPPDRKYQHILWRFDPQDTVQQFELCTITYGTSSAPFQAQRAIIQLVRDEGDSYPWASKVLQEDIYVDDIATGAASVDEAKQLASELKKLLSKGCFELGKWASNSPQLLKFLQSSEGLHEAACLTEDDDPKIKLLGMHWIPDEDLFSYEITTPSWHPSKRAILSAIARIYDPLGFLSPVVFYAKTILQDLWISKCGWDDVGPPEICLRWHQFISQLDSISQVKIPRRVVDKECKSSILVGFCDASERGYAAVLYLVENTQSGYKVHLIRARTKLSPINRMIIPRLELSGALLLSRLYQSCASLRNKLSICCTRFFTDSTIVLGWISTPSQQLNAFVAHRVVQIFEITNMNDWYHVKSEENPTDCSSSGLLPSELGKHLLWWAGPRWLMSPLKRWPRLELKTENLPELKRITVVLVFRNTSLWGINLVSFVLSTNELSDTNLDSLNTYAPKADELNNA